MKIKKLLRLLTVASFLFAGSVSAQLINCNAFLKGAYVEVGINWTGAYGSSVPPPAGYHPNNGGTTHYLTNSAVCGGASAASDSLLGFVADPDMDGWSTGTPPYFGDYFLPGTPQEGWSIQSDGIEHDVWNEHDDAVLDTSVHGSNISYSDSAGHMTATWLGMFDSIAIVQITTLDTYSTYFNVNVILTNLSTTAKNNVYYLRTVDPDNDAAETGGYATRNVIDYQLPNAYNLSTVSSSALINPNAYLALTTNDLRAKVFLNIWGSAPAYPLDQLFDETAGYVYTPGAVDSNDEAIGLVFNIGHLSSVDSAGAIDSAYRTTSVSPAPNRAIINYQYAFHVPSGPTAITNIAATGIKVYPNPAKDLLNITNIYTTDHIKVLDMMGRQMDGNWQVTNDGNNRFSTANLPSGQYILQITDKDGVAKYKTAVQKL